MGSDRRRTGVPALARPSPSHCRLRIYMLSLARWFPTEMPHQTEVATHRTVLENLAVASVQSGATESVVGARGLEPRTPLPSREAPGRCQSSPKRLCDKGFRRDRSHLRKHTTLRRKLSCTCAALVGFRRTCMSEGRSEKVSAVLRLSQPQRTAIYSAIASAPGIGMLSARSPSTCS